MVNISNLPSRRIHVVAKVQFQIRFGRTYHFRIFTKIDNGWVTRQNEAEYAGETHQGRKKSCFFKTFVEIDLCIRTSPIFWKKSTLWFPHFRKLTMR